MIRSDRVMGEGASIDFDGVTRCHPHPHCHCLSPGCDSTSLHARTADAHTQPNTYIPSGIGQRPVSAPQQGSSILIQPIPYWNHQTKTMNARVSHVMFQQTSSLCICMLRTDNQPVMAVFWIRDKLEQLTRGSVYNCTHRLGASHPPSPPPLML